MFVPQDGQNCNSFVRVKPGRSYTDLNCAAPWNYESLTGSLGGHSGLIIRFTTGTALPGYYSKALTRAEAASKTTNSLLPKDQYVEAMENRVEGNRGPTDLLSVQQQPVAQGRAVATMAGAMCVVALMAVMAVHQARRRQRRTAAGYTDIL